MKYYVYIIQSEVNNRFYIGSSTDSQLRLKRHNQGWTKSTKPYKPWRLVYTEEYDSKSEALLRERQIKSWKSHKAIEKIINSRVAGRPDD